MKLNDKIYFGAGMIGLVVGVLTCLLLVSIGVGIIRWYVYFPIIFFNQQFTYFGIILIHESKEKRIEG